MSGIDPELKATVEANLQTAADELQLPLEVFMEIVNESMEPTKQDMAALDDAVASGNFKDIQTVSHKLKGTFGNLRLDSLVSKSKRINDLSKQEEGIDEIRQLLPSLSEDFEKFSAIIESS